MRRNRRVVEDNFRKVVVGTEPTGGKNYREDREISSPKERDAVTGAGCKPLTCHREGKLKRRLQVDVKPINPEFLHLRKGRTK